MSTISPSQPMKAYDHVSNLLKEAGHGDGIISRSDAKQLVADLRGDGRGTEALAAENLFKMIDHFDDEPGARITNYDLNATRNFVQNKMLNNRDVNKDGFSRPEIAEMSPTGRALIEIGQTLDMEAVRGRIAHNVPEQGMNHIAGLISEAGGADGIISRDDVSGLMHDLYTQGRGTEALAVGTFFSFIDHRDHESGARVTDFDINKAVNYSTEHLLENKDKNSNGYSKAEVAKFSTSAKAFLLVGQMIDAGIIKAAE